MAHEVNLQALLASKDKFHIPFYQRKYSWRKSDVETFFTDAVETNGHLYVGLFVTAPHQAMQGEVDIVDGQQRLTTMILALSLIESHLSDINAGNSWMNLNLTPQDRSLCLSLIGAINLAIVPNDELVLEVSSPNSGYSELLNVLALPSNAFYNHYPNQTNSTRSLAKNKIDTALGLSGISARKETLFKNYKILNNSIIEHISQVSQAPNTAAGVLRAFKDLMDCFLRDVRLIHFEAPNIDFAFKLFESLNSKGKPVSSSDLIKNLCMMHSRAHMDAIYELWSRYFDDILEDKQGVYFFRTWWNSKYDFIQASRVYTSFESKINSVPRPNANGGRGALDWLEDLGSDVRNLAFMLDNRNSTCSIGSSVMETAVVVLRLSGAIQWHAVALSAFRLYPHLNGLQEKIALEELMKAVVVLIAVRDVTDSPANKVEKFLPGIAVKLDDMVANASRRGASALNSLIATIDDLRSAMLGGHVLKTLISEIDFSENKRALFYLSVLRFDSNPNGASWVPGTLEHIYPQSPGNGNWPAFDVLPIKEQEELRYSLGNMLDLDGPRNASASNLPFSDKLPRYVQANPFDCVSQPSLKVQVQNDWTPQIVRDRSDEIVDLLVDFLN